MAGQKTPHVDDPRAVGRRIREARLSAGLGQAELAAGECAPAYVSKIESGERTPSLQLLRRFGQRLGLSADYLATGSDGSEAELALTDAQLAMRLGDSEPARRAFEGLASHDDVRIREQAELGLAQLASAAGDSVRVIELLEPRYAARGPRPSDPDAVELLVLAYRYRGDRPAALALLDREITRAANDGVAFFRLNVLLANLLIDLGEFTRAESVLATAFNAVPDPGDPIALARCLWSQSRLKTAQGAPDLALEYASDALALIRGTEHDEYAARAYHLVAYIELERGDAARALELLESAEPIVLRSEDARHIALHQLDRARALAALGRLEEAQQLAGALVAELDGLDPGDAARALGVLAGIAEARGAVAEALRLYETAVEAVAEGPNEPMLVDLYANWSDLLERTGNVEKALEVARLALHARTASTP